MTRAEILACLGGRPCDVCKFNEDGGCTRWNCVFEEQPDDAETKGEWFAITQPWVDTQIFQCTCCGRHIEVPQYEVSTLTIRYPFCHCGADMRGKV